MLVQCAFVTWVCGGTGWQVGAKCQKPHLVPWPRAPPSHTLLTNTSVRYPRLKGHAQDARKHHVSPSHTRLYMEEDGSGPLTQVGGPKPAHILRMRQDGMQPVLIYAYPTWGDVWSATMDMLQRETQRTLLTAVLDVDDTLVTRKNRITPHGSDILRSVYLSGLEPIFITSRPDHMHFATYHMLHAHVLRLTGMQLNVGSSVLACLPEHVKHKCMHAETPKVAQETVRAWKEASRKHMAHKHKHSGRYTPQTRTTHESEGSGSETSSSSEEEGTGELAESGGESGRGGGGGVSRKKGIRVAEKFISKLKARVAAKQHVSTSMPVTRKERTTTAAAYGNEHTEVPAPPHGVCVGDHWRDLAGSNWRSLGKNANVQRLGQEYFLLCTGLDPHSRVSIKIPEILRGTGMRGE